MAAHFRLTGEETVVDLSHPFTSQMMPYPGDPPLVFDPLAQVPDDGYLLHRISGTAHTGTHLDAPAHFLPAGLTIDQLPASHWMGTAMLLDVRGQAVIDAPLPASLTSGAIDFLIFRTDWDQYFDTPQYFSDHPSFGQAFARRLAALPVKAIGMDMPGPDHDPYPVHQILLQAGMALIENMTHLDQIPAGGVFTLFALPLQWPLEASWVRPIAFLPPGD